MSERELIDEYKILREIPEDTPDDEVKGMLGYQFHAFGDAFVELSKFIPAQKIVDALNASITWKGWENENR